MRNLLFLSLKAVSLEASDGKRILEIGMRLVSHNNIQDLRQLVRPTGYSTPAAVAAICTQQLVVDYFQHLGEPIHCSNTKLAGTHRRLFGEELVDGHDALVEAIACQRIYNFCSVFQQEQETTFLSDIVCLED